MKQCWGRRNKVGDAHQPEWKQGDEEEEEEEEEGKGDWRKERQREGEEAIRAVVVEAGPSSSRQIHVREAPRPKKRVSSTPSSRSSYLSVVPGVHSSHMSAIAEQNED